MTPHEALYYEKAAGGAVRCALCPRRCAIGDGKTGACGARRNVGGVLYARNYGRISALALDPIEKKPLRRFKPGSVILSVGSFGCNMFCLFCQNHEISRGTPATYPLMPGELARRALDARADGNIGLAFTYNEPTVAYEFVLDAAKAAAAVGLDSVLVTNGYIEPEPLAELLPYVAAMNIDLKGDASFYTELCGADRGAVTRTVRAAHAAGVHVEVTALLVTGRNDNEAAVMDIAETIADISRNIPLHLTRYFPSYKTRGAEPTDAAFVREATVYARRVLTYVYTGNV